MLSALVASARRLGGLRGFRHKDAVALVLLVGLPLLLYGIPAAAGHPVLPGDDLTQNEPLRVLVGDIMRSGRLPAWDPLIWSGSPLLAGWNAGAMFPLTWLFVFLPSLFAWTLNLALAPGLAGAGFDLLARRLSCGPLPSLLGALVFTYTGYLSGQIVHLGLEQGGALLPYMLIAIDGLGRRPDRRTTAGWIALLGASLGLCVLAGDPRAVSNAAIVCVIALVAVCIRAGRAFVVPLLSALGAALVGGACSAIQWLPGIGFLRNSQRGAIAYEFFGSGSISIGHLVAMLLDPFIFGGNGNFVTPTYAGPFNLPELTVGSGLVALVALLVYLPGLFSREARRRPDRRRLGAWYVMVLVGVVLTLGATTPLGEVLVHVPFFGGERLQNRNAAIFDLALAVILTFFLDDAERLAARTADAPGSSPRRAGRPGKGVGLFSSRLSRLFGVVPAVLAGALALDALVDPDAVSSAFQLTAPFPQWFSLLGFYLVFSLVCAFALGLFVVAAGRMAPRTVRAGLIAFVLVDVAVYLVNGDYATVPSAVLGPNAQAKAVSGLIGRTGRYAIYDPALLVPDNDPYALYEFGVTDDNLLHGTPSVQGYGSIVSGVYQNVTETHDADDLNTARLQGQSFDTLDLRTLLTLPDYFQQSVSAHAPIPLDNGQTLGGSPGVPVPPLAPLATGPWPLLPGQSGRWQLASPVHVGRATLSFAPQLNGFPKSVEITGYTASGGERAGTVAVQKDGAAVLRFPKGFVADAIGVKNLGKVTGVLEAVVAVSVRPSSRIVLDGALQAGTGSVVAALSAPQWRFAGTVGPLVAYDNTETRGLAWLQPSTSTTPNAAARTNGHIRVVTNSPVSPQVMVVSTPVRAVLVRSEGYSAGWTARLTPAGGGPTKVVAVRRFGLVQAVSVPAGSYTVTWRYAPRELLVGLVLSIAGALALLGLVIDALPAALRRAGRARKR